MSGVRWTVSEILEGDPVEVGSFGEPAEGPLSMGRSARCSIRIGNGDTSVSRHAADFVYGDGAWWLKNCGRAGIAIKRSGHPATLEAGGATALFDGMMVVVGRTKCTISGPVPFLGASLDTMTPKGRRALSLGPFPATLGSASSCDLTLNASGVSRQHVRLSWAGSSCRFLLEDLGSQNGTFVSSLKGDPPQRIEAPVIIGSESEFTVGCAVCKVVGISRKRSRKHLWYLLGLVPLCLLLTGLLTREPAAAPPPQVDTYSDDVVRIWTGLASSERDAALSVLVVSGGITNVERLHAIEKVQLLLRASRKLQSEIRELTSATAAWQTAIAEDPWWEDVYRHRLDDSELSQDLAAFRHQCSIATDFRDGTNVLVSCDALLAGAAAHTAVPAGESLLARHREMEAASKKCAELILDWQSGERPVERACVSEFIVCSERLGLDDPVLESIRSTLVETLKSRQEGLDAWGELLKGVTDRVRGGEALLSGEGGEEFVMPPIASACPRSFKDQLLQERQPDMFRRLSAHLCENPGRNQYSASGLEELDWFVDLAGHIRKMPPHIDVKSLSAEVGSQVEELSGELCKAIEAFENQLVALASELAHENPSNRSMTPAAKTLAEASTLAFSQNETIRTDGLRRTWLTTNRRLRDACLSEYADLAYLAAPQKKTRLTGLLDTLNALLIDLPPEAPESLETALSWSSKLLKRLEAQ